jgi:predicted AlkP superfamily phosphohydrolase/phosphomutase
MNPVQLNLTLPPYMYDAAMSSSVLTPSLSMTYSPPDFKTHLQVQQSQFARHMEDVNKAAQSGRPVLTAAMVSKANEFASAYHENVRKTFPVVETSPLVGTSRTTSLKSKTEKMMSEE